MESCSPGGTGQHHAAWILIDDYIMAEMGDKWTMENVPCGMLPGCRTHLILPSLWRKCALNGQWRTSPDAGWAGESSHYITDYCLAGGMGNGEWRKRDANCSPGQGCAGNVHLGSADAPSPAMEWTTEPGKIHSNLKGRVAAKIKLLPPFKLYL